MNIIIEKASASDASAILEFLKQIGGETDNLTFGAEGMPFSEESEASFLNYIEKSHDDVMLVAKVDGRIVANVSLSRTPRRMSHRGDLGVAVIKEYWNRGIGGQLLEKIIEFAKANAFEVIDLQVRSDNLQAIHLYEKYGFQKIGIHPYFFKIDEAYISFDYMCLKI